MGFFAWSAPLFGRYGDRWSPETVARYRDWLRPHVPPGGSVLDLGGGTGALARRLAETLECRVTVLDPTPEMVVQMEPHERVTAVIGSAEAMPFENATFDALVISDAFHHFRDQEGAAREIARVVRPAGGVLVLEFDPSGWMRLVVLGEKLLGEPGAFFTPAEACAFFSRFGIEGHCEHEPGGRTKYYFLGTVARPRA
ncbi:MAG: hypothetical protein C0418_05685 [Coriobacteriaceae bacterium]|nr:hypothetical protein [Coriobacteriaceae bacterium]